jgi:hypothetical protein
VIASRAKGDEDNQIDTREGEEVSLPCRFNADYSDRGFIYYWAALSSKFENVAFGDSILNSAYK